MEASDIAKKLQKVIDIHKEDYVYNKVYFNPIFLRDLYEDVPELKESGIEIEVKETESGQGTIKAGLLISGDRRLDLGSVLLDGENIVVKNRLQTVDKLVAFVKREAEAIQKKTVQEKEDAIIRKEPVEKPVRVSPPKPEPKSAPKPEPKKEKPEPQEEKPERKEPGERRKLIERT